MQKVIAAERLRAVLQYDSLTGVFTWTEPTSFRVRRGDTAGVRKEGYTFIGIDGRQYGAHRLAVLYVTGVFPDREVDHMNGDRSDNRFENLRLVSHKMNMQNERRPRRNNSTGFMGVSFCKKTGKFRAFLSVDGKSSHLGRFNTPEEAHAAYTEAKRAIHEGAIL